MLDLIFVLSDHKPSEFETIQIGTSREWDKFEPKTRTAAQFHGANQRRFPLHYLPKLNDMPPMDLAKLQRSPECPILYFPFVELPRSAVR